MSTIGQTKTFRSLSRSLVGCAVAFIFAVPATGEPVEGIVRSVRGSARISANGTAWKTARVRARVGENYTIKTAAKGTVDLFLFENGPVVRVAPDSVLGLDKLDRQTTVDGKVIATLLDLQRGRILGKVKRLPADAAYEVKTLEGVAFIREAAEYDIGADGSIKVYSGRVGVIYICQAGIPVTLWLTAGQSISAEQVAQSWLAKKPVVLIPGQAGPKPDDFPN